MNEKNNENSNLEEEQPKPQENELQNDSIEQPQKPDEVGSQKPDEEELPKKQEREFKVNMQEHIKKIPDYVDYNSVAIHQKRKKNVFVKVMFGLIIVGISVTLALVIIFASRDVFGMGKPDAERLVEIKPNSSVTDIAQVLEDNDLITSAYLFRAYYKFAKIEGNFQYGTYSLNTNMSYDVIISELQKYAESNDEVSVLIKEGQTIYEISEILEEKKVCSAEDFVKAINNADFGFEFEKGIGENSLRFHRLEGYLFPDTYKFFVKDNPTAVAKKMLSTFELRVGEDISTKLANTGLTQDELITVASIVQKEAGKTDEMKRVASVYINRLKNKGEYSRLQADPTREYANQLKLQMKSIDQKIIDAYNTYKGIGLPPGPICNPGVEAIKAVLEPESTDYYYFCSNLKTGEFYYAKTLKEHNRNVKKAGLRQ